LHRRSSVNSAVAGHASGACRCGKKIVCLDASRFDAGCRSLQLNGERVLLRLLRVRAHGDQSGATAWPGMRQHLTWAAAECAAYLQQKRAPIRTEPSYRRPARRCTHLQVPHLLSGSFTECTTTRLKDSFSAGKHHADIYQRIIHQEHPMITLLRRYFS
jgi:hypothetical protein